MLTLRRIYAALLAGILTYGCSAKSFSMQPSTSKGIHSAPARKKAKFIGNIKREEGPDELLLNIKREEGLDESLFKLLALPDYVREKVYCYLYLNDLKNMWYAAIPEPERKFSEREFIESILQLRDTYFSRGKPYTIYAGPSAGMNNAIIKTRLGFVKDFKVPHVCLRGTVVDGLYSALNDREQFPDLKTLRLLHGANTRDLRKVLPNLERGYDVLTDIDLGKGQAADGWVTAYLSRCKKLKSVELPDGGDVGLRLLMCCPALNALNLCDSSISDEAIKEVLDKRPDFKGLRRLVIGSDSSVSPEGMEMLREVERKNPNFELCFKEDFLVGREGEVELPDGGDEGLRLLIRYPNVTSLNLCDSCISDEAIKEVLDKRPNFKGLKRLVIGSDNSVSPEGMEMLREVESKNPYFKLWCKEEFLVIQEQEKESQVQKLKYKTLYK